MTSPEARKAHAPAIDFSATKAAVWLTLTAFLALLVLYFVGMDQGATSVFGDNMSSTSSCMMPAICSASPATDAQRRPTAMEKQIIWRGLLAGAVAGVFAFIFARSSSSPSSVGHRLRGRHGAAHEAMVPPAGMPARWLRSVHPRRPGQHRHGPRRAGLQRRHGRIVRGRVRVAYGASATSRRDCCRSSGRRHAVQLYIVPA